MNHPLSSSASLPSPAEIARIHAPEIGDALCDYYRIDPSEKLFVHIDDTVRDEHDRILCLVQRGSGFQFFGASFGVDEQGKRNTPVTVGACDGLAEHECRQAGLLPNESEIF